MLSDGFYIFKSTKVVCMKYELQTIPVWDGLHSGCECLLCELMKKAETHAVSYFLGSSVMHPETRVEVNAKGFCPSHWSKLIKANKPQALGLISHTYLEATMQKLEKSFRQLERAKAGRKTANAVDEVVKAIETREAGCLICEQMENTLARYAFTTVHLWKQDPEFRTEFSQSKGVCLHHMITLLHMAPETLDAGERLLFAQELAELTKRNLARLEREVWWMTQKYKSEHQDAPWNGCEDAHKRVVRKLTGESRILT